MLMPKKRPTKLLKSLTKPNSLKKSSKRLVQGSKNADKGVERRDERLDPAAKEKAQQEKDDADKDVRIKDQAKRDAETELEKAKEDDKTREAKKGQEQSKQS